MLIYSLYFTLRAEEPGAGRGVTVNDGIKEYIRGGHSILTPVSAAVNKDLPIYYIKVNF